MIQYPMGLYDSVAAGEGIRDFDLIQFAPLWGDPGVLVGGLFVFRDFRFALLLKNTPLPDNLGLPPQALRDWPTSKMIYHMS
jgi:hypothetical protein